MRIALVEIGELDPGLSLAQTLGSNGNLAAIKKIVETFAEEDFHDAWDDPGGIKIVIGATGMKLKDGATTSEALAKIAQAVRDGGDALVRARTLSFIANLQAMTHDFAGARGTALAIPEIRRGDFPGPSDGFYDAIKPATLAINAELQAAAGDRAGALENLRGAVVLSRGIKTASEKLVAQIVIIQKELACGEHDLASALLREAIPFAIAQAEPVRSRAGDACRKPGEGRRRNRSGHDLARSANIPDSKRTGRSGHSPIGTTGPETTRWQRRFSASH